MGYALTRTFGACSFFILLKFFTNKKQKQSAKNYSVGFKAVRAELGRYLLYRSRF